MLMYVNSKLNKTGMFYFISRLFELIQKGGSQGVISCVSVFINIKRAESGTKYNFYVFIIHTAVNIKFMYCNDIMPSG